MRIARTLLPLALAAGFVVGSAGAASAAPAPATVVVAPGQSVADALNRVAPGGTVLLQAGVHRPATFGPKAWSSTVTLRPVDGAEDRVDLGELNLRGVEGLVIRDVSTRGLVTIDGGRAVTVTSSRPAGVLVKNGASQIEVTDNTIVGGWNGVTVQSWVGTARPHHVRIAGNHIEGQQNDNVQIGIAHDVVVEDNELLDPVDNTNHNDGVQLMGGQRVVVRNNHFTGQDQAVMVKPETSLGTDSAVVDARIEGNLIEGTREFGVILVDTTNTALVDNTVRDIPKVGVLFVGNNTGATLVGNVISKLFVEAGATAPLSVL